MVRDWTVSAGLSCDLTFSSLTGFLVCKWFSVMLVPLRSENPRPGPVQSSLLVPPPSFRTGPRQYLVESWRRSVRSLLSPLPLLHPDSLTNTPATIPALLLCPTKPRPLCERVCLCVCESVCVCVRQTADANDGTSVKMDRLTKSTVQSPCIFTQSLSESYDQLFGLRLM